MKILFTICARAGSKGLKNKNIKIFCERPLVEWTLDIYRQFKAVYSEKYESIDLALNTDSLELLQQVEDYQEPFVYIERKDELAGDFVSKLSVIRDTLIQMQDRKKCSYDVVIDLDLTSPIRKVEDVVGTLEMLLNSPAADVAFSVTESRRNPYFNMVSQREDGFYDKVMPSDFVSRQQAPECYDMNASIYAYRKEYVIAESTQRKAVIWKMKDTGVLDIDSEEDFELLEVIAQYLMKKMG